MSKDKPKSLGELKERDVVSVDWLIENSGRHASYSEYDFYEILGFDIVVITESAPGNPSFDKITAIYDRRKEGEVK